MLYPQRKIRHASIEFIPAAAARGVGKFVRTLRYSIFAELSAAAGSTLPSYPSIGLVWRPIYDDYVHAQRVRCG